MPSERASGGDSVLTFGEVEPALPLKPSEWKGHFRLAAVASYAEELPTALTDASNLTWPAEWSLALRAFEVLRRSDMDFPRSVSLSRPIVAATSLLCTATVDYRVSLVWVRALPASFGIRDAIESCFCVWLLLCSCSMERFSMITSDT